MKWIQSWVATLPSPLHLERNEDNLWVAANQRAAAVIDGMGGYRRKTATGVVGGEHASAIAAEVLAEYLDKWDGNDDLESCKQALREAIEAVNRHIWEELNWGGKIPANENPTEKPIEELTVGVVMTVVALFDNGQRAVAAQHGDTHGYVLKPRGLWQLTEDQDLLRWEYLHGLVSDEDLASIKEAIDNFDGTIENMPERRVMRYFLNKNVFGALGVDTECPQTDWSVIKLEAGDRLALLSDGAYSNMSLNELTRLLGYPDDPATVVVELAQQRGQLPRYPNSNDPTQPYNMRATQDDMTVVVVEVGPDDA